MLKNIAIALTLAGICTTALAAENKQRAAKRRRKPNPAMAAIEDVAGLPRVLLIGDSISIGYTLPVRKLLEGRANVHRPKANCGPTTRGLQAIDKWLGEGKWDVIHFNWGLHDLKYMGPKGENLADPAAAVSRQQVPVKEYVANLEQLVARLKKTGASLIWCTTTPVAPETKGRVHGDSAKYNAAAAEVMAKHDVAIDDLYTFANDRLEQIQRPRNVHFSSKGSETLAEQVAKSISAALK